jgi:hypothetical protein
MHYAVVWRFVVLAAALLACNDPVGPTSLDATEAGSIVEVPRQRRRQTPPDSLYIPPTPLPPIHEELPRIKDITLRTSLWR